jgi:hypothetical protein
VAFGHGHPLVLLIKGIEESPYEHRKGRIISIMNVLEESRIKRDYKLKWKEIVSTFAL